MDRRDAPPTEEGWFALHDFRTVDWDGWREADPGIRDRAIDEGIAHLSAAEGLEDAEEGASATYTVVGHKADLLVVHFRPTLAAVNALERQFEHTALADVTERAASFVSVTEASGYTVPEYFEDDDAEIDAGLRRYMESRIRPSIPDAEYICFYPMDKRRGPDHNWYDLPFEDRAEYMSAHGDIGREYAGKVNQIITGSIGLDDWEWGVTLFANDPAAFKRLLYDMRFDPSSSRFAEFGRFFVGQRLPPDHLEAFLAGDALGEAASDAAATPPGHPDRSDHGPHGGGTPDDAGGDGTGTGTGNGDGGEEALRSALADLDVYAGQPHGEDVYAVTLYSEADAEELFEAVSGLRGNFDHYDTHVETAVYEDRGADRHAVTSLWETESAAETAAGFLADLPEVVGRAGEEEGWGTMGMFYTVKSDHREDFVETFDEVEALLSEMEGHRETRLLVNHEDPNDMFIASLWRSRDDAMEFFRSDAFRETVSWGREVLADRPRHIFLA